MQTDWKKQTTFFLASQTISIFGTSSVQSNFTIGILTVALGLVPFFWVYLAFMLLCGVSFPVFNAPSTVILQQRVEDDFRGRVFGLLGMLSGSSWNAAFRATRRRGQGRVVAHGDRVLDLSPGSGDARRQDPGQGRQPICGSCITYKASTSKHISGQDSDLHEALFSGTSAQDARHMD